VSAQHVLRQELPAKWTRLHATSQNHVCETNWNVISSQK